MTHKNTYMPRKDAEFIAWAKTIYRDCSEREPLKIHFYH
jgi:hypothetical protein